MQQPKALHGNSSPVPALSNLTSTPVQSSPSGEIPAALEHYFLAVFAVKGHGTHVVEVPHTQQPYKDRAAAWAKIRKQFPKVNPKTDIRRTGGAIQSRTPGEAEPTIAILDGMTIRQLFVDGSDTETSRHVGRVVFNGAPCEVGLRFIRAKSSWSVSLKEIGTRSTTNFSEQHPAQVLVTELEKFVMKTLGGAAAGLRFFFVKK